MTRAITPEEKEYANNLLQRARAAVKASEYHDQARVDRLCQAVGWATANEPAFVRLTRMRSAGSALQDRWHTP